MPLFIPEESYERKVTKEEIYKEVDKFLNRLYKGDTGGVIEINVPAAIPMLEKYGLITFRNPSNKRTSIIDITLKGIDVIESGGIQKYLGAIELAEKESRELEERKMKVDLELAEQMLKDYPGTKKQAKWAIILSIVAIVSQVIMQLIEWIAQ